MIVSGTKWESDLSRAGRSKYKALASAIREGIVSGQMKAGHKLPPVRELAFQVEMTPGTVARAYKLLIDEGRLEAGVGRGTFVAGGAAVDGPEKSTAPVLHDPVIDVSVLAHLLSPRMPDVGQTDMIRAAMTRFVAQTDSASLLQYPDRKSDYAARSAFAQTMDLDHTGSFSTDDVVVSHGGQNGVVAVLQTILRGSGPEIAVDELSYVGFRSAAQLTRAGLVGIPWDNDGPMVSALEAAIKEKGIQAYCASAEVCNPTVQTTTVERRQEVARLAERYGLHVIDDDCYRLMRTEYTGPSYRALLPEQGWYVTSPSKSISPVLRIGFVIAPQGWGAALVRTATFESFGVSRVVTDIYADMMGNPDLAAVLEKTKARVRKDIRAAVNILGGFQMRWDVSVPFFWLELPPGWRVGEFCQAAVAAGVLVKSADDFALRDGRSVHAVRVAVNGQVPHEKFEEAMHILLRLLQNPPDRLII